MKPKPKNLREQLLERDRAVEPRLDAMRLELLAAMAGERRSETTGAWPGPLAMLRLAWRELVHPCRGVWAALAAAWVAVLALQVLNRPPAPSGSRASAVEVAAIYSFWREQQRLLAGLGAPVRPAELPAPVSPPAKDQPRSGPLGAAPQAASLHWV